MADGWRQAFDGRSLAEQAAHVLIFIDRDMQIGRRDADVAVADSFADLGQRAATGQGVADERVPAVVNRQGPQPFTAKRLACRPETLADRVPDKALSETARSKAADKVIGGP